MALIKHRTLWSLTKSVMILYMAAMVIGGFIYINQLEQQTDSSLSMKIKTFQELEAQHMNSINQNLPYESPVQGTDRPHRPVDEPRVKLNPKIHPAARVNHSGCSEWYKETFAENLRVISEYPRGNVSAMLTNIKGSWDTPATMMTSFPVIVTAANSGFYGVTQALLKSIHTLLVPKYPELKIIYYDLGLQAVQIEELKIYCKCEVRTFPFQDYPPHVKRLKTYAWKPIIVQTVLMEFGWVWWMDSSVRFVTSDLDRALQYSTDNHILFLTYGPSLSVAFNTDKQTMQYLEEDPCKFRPFGEIEATFVLFHYSDVTSVLVEAWCACALIENCMAPPGTANKLSCNQNKRSDGRCHRFDQAVLSIMLRRLYHDQNDYPLVDTPFHIHKIQRGHIVNYFQGLKQEP